MSPFIATFLALAICGISIASFLAYKHRVKSSQPLVCPLNSRCDVVIESKWSTILGIRNEILGIIFYVGLFAAGICLIFIPQYTQKILLALVIVGGLGSAFSLLLTYLQFSIIKNYCFYCILSALTAILLWINTIALYAQQ